MSRGAIAPYHIVSIVVWEDAVATASAAGFYRRTFGHVVAVIYTGGSVAHLLKLLFAFGWEYMPYWVDWLLIILGTYGGFGLVIFAAEVKWRGTWEKFLHGLIAVHLLASVLVHVWTVVVESHGFFTLFPYEYSFFALGYFVFFAWRSWTMQLIPLSTNT